MLMKFDMMELADFPESMGELANWEANEVERAPRMAFWVASFEPENKDRMEEKSAKFRDWNCSWRRSRAPFKAAPRPPAEDPEPEDAPEPEAPEPELAEPALAAAPEPELAEPREPPKPSLEANLDANLEPKPCPLATDTPIRRTIRK